MRKSPLTESNAWQQLTHHIVHRFLLLICVQWNIATNLLVFNMKKVSIIDPYCFRRTKLSNISASSIFPLDSFSLLFDFHCIYLWVFFHKKDCLSHVQHGPNAFISFVKSLTHANSVQVVLRGAPSFPPHTH